jgi:hypothetical protein
LEEAEEKMNKRRSSASGCEQRLIKVAANGASAFSSGVKKLEDVKEEGATNGVHPKKGDKNENGNQSVKSEEDEEGRAARNNSHGLTTKGVDEDDEEGGKDKDFDLDDEIEKGIHVACHLLLFLRFCLHFIHYAHALLLFLRTIHTFTPERIKRPYTIFPYHVLGLFCNLRLSGDHWEHEEIFTDDDETLDIDIEERPDLADPEAAPPEIKEVNRDDHAALLLVRYLLDRSADSATLTKATTPVDAISDFYHNTRRMIMRLN